jgi:hypothetical protein
MVLIIYIALLSLKQGTDRALAEVRAAVYQRRTRFARLCWFGLAKLALYSGLRGR